MYNLTAEVVEGEKVVLAVYQIEDKASDNEENWNHSSWWKIYYQLEVENYPCSPCENSCRVDVRICRNRDKEDNGYNRVTGAGAQVDESRYIAAYQGEDNVG